MKPPHGQQPLPLAPLSSKEKKVLEFLHVFFAEQALIPSFQEIRQHFGFASLNSVQRYLKQLQRKGYIYAPGGNQKRALRLLTPPPAQMDLRPQSSPIEALPQPLQLAAAASVSLPLLGRVAAGKPLEALEHDEFVEIPGTYVNQPERSYALKVEGQSMVDDGIFEGDTLFVQKQSIARNGDTVIAMVENEATVKKFYLHDNPTKLIHRYPHIPPHFLQSPALVELRPANQQMESMWFEPHQIEIQGIVVGLLRKFNL